MRILVPICRIDIRCTTRKKNAVERLDQVVDELLVRYLLNVFSKLGNGLGYLVSFLMSVTPSPDTPAMATFEYGGRMVEAAGLLNYLAAIDAIDIHFGRKK